MSRSATACLTVLFPLLFWLKRSLMARLFHQGSSPWWSNSTSFDLDAVNGVAVKSLHSLAGYSGFAIPPTQFLLGVLCGPLFRFREGTQFCRLGTKFPSAVGSSWGQAGRSWGSCPSSAWIPKGSSCESGPDEGCDLSPSFLDPPGSNPQRVGDRVSGFHWCPLGPTPKEAEAGRARARFGHSPPLRIFCVHLSPG